MSKEKVSNTAERLHELMRVNNMKQIDLSEKTGLHKSTISYYLSGKREPAQDNIFVISQTFNVDPAWLMGYDVPMSKNKSVDFSKEVAEILIRVQEDQSLIDFIKKYESLSEQNKEIIRNLVEGLAKYDD